MRTWRPPLLVLVAVSGYGQEQDRRRSQEAGFDTHMVKPVDIAVLSRFLADAVPPIGGPRFAA